jgi:hypothetical protein
MALINIILFLLLSSCSTYTLADNRIKIGIIDSGMSEEQSKQPYVCGNRNLTFDKSPYDTNGHGTNIVSIIAPSVNPKTHCIIMYKAWSEGMSDGASNIAFVLASFYASRDKVKFLNISMSGSFNSAVELTNLHNILKDGGVITVSAGNDSADLSKKCEIYPACYGGKLSAYRFYVVGNMLSNTEKSPYSNYGGPVNRWENGHNVGTPSRTGTSQSSALHMSKILKEEK